MNPEQANSQPSNQPSEQAIRARVATIQEKREVLVRLLEQPDLGTLRIDVNQALEEVDELLAEFQQTFSNS